MYRDVWLMYLILDCSFYYFEIYNSSNIYIYIYIPYSVFVFQPPFSLLLKVLLNWCWNISGLKDFFNSFHTLIPLCCILGEFHDLVFPHTQSLFSDMYPFCLVQPICLDFTYLILYISKFYYLQCWLLFTLKISHLFLSKYLFTYEVFFC